MNNGQAVKRPRMALFFVVATLLWFGGYTYVPTFTPYLDSHGVSYTFIGAISGAYGLAQLLLRVPIGILSDRMGRRKPFVVFGLLAGTLSALLFCFTESAAVMWLLRFLSGVSVSNWVVFTILFSSYFDSAEMASRISLLNFTNTFGVMAGKLAGSAVVQAGGQKAAFWLAAGAGAVGLMLSFFIRENAPPVREQPTLRQLLSVIKDRNLRYIAVLALFLQMAVYSTVNTFTPEVAARLGANAAQLGILATLSSLPGVFITIFLGWLFARRVHFRNLIVIALSLCALGTVMTAFATTLLMVYVGSVVVGIGFGTGMTSMLSYSTLTVDPARRGVAMGFYQATYSIGMFVGPIVVGGFSQWLGLSAGMMSAVAILLVGILLAFLLLDGSGGKQPAAQGGQRH